MLLPRRGAASFGGGFEAERRARLDVELGGAPRQDVGYERGGVEVEQDGGALAQRPQLSLGVGAAPAEEAHHARRARRLR